MGKCRKEMLVKNICKIIKKNIKKQNGRTYQKKMEKDSLDRSYRESYRDQRRNNLDFFRDLRLLLGWFLGKRQSLLKKKAEIELGAFVTLGNIRKQFVYSARSCLCVYIVFNIVHFLNIRHITYLA